VAHNIKASLPRTMTVIGILLVFLIHEGTEAQLFVPDLPPGTIYHLAFVSDGLRDATSAQISEYDAFVNADADANPDLADIQWLALASTPTVDAIDHVPVSGPVFRLDGEFVAADGEDLWDGFIEVPLSITPSGATAQPALVWTGTGRFGLEKSLQGGCGLGADPGCNGSPFQISSLGDSRSPGRWIDAARSATQTELHRLYAASEPLSVPIPEPCGLASLLLGTICLFVQHRQQPRVPSC
jgi:hypothetical protein